MFQKRFGDKDGTMSWFPLLLAVWIVFDVVVVVAIVGATFNRMRLRAANSPRPRSPLVSGRSTSRYIH